MSSEKKLGEYRKVFFDGIGVPVPQPFVADEFQLQAIDSLNAGFDTLVIAPTGAGKTFIAIESIKHVVEKGLRAVYTAPLKALSNAKYAELKKLFEPKFRVGLLTGDRKIEGDAEIVVATTEIYRNELYSYSENYALVVLDEFHYLADPQRGPVWEESVVLSPRSATLLLLSASISNPLEISAWIEEVRSKAVRIITVPKRPVELRLGFLHDELGVLPLQDSAGNILPEVQSYYTEGRPLGARGFRRGGFRNYGNHKGAKRGGGRGSRRGKNR